MSDRHPEWREQPDYRDWPDHQGEADTGQDSNGRHGNHGRGQAPRPTTPDWPDGAPQAGHGWDEDQPEQDGGRWAGPAAPGWRGVPNPPRQPGSGRQGPDRPDLAGRRWADQGTPPTTGEAWRDPGQPGGWQDSGERPAQERRDPAQPGQQGGWQDSGERPAQERRDPAQPQRRGGRHDSGQWSAQGWRDPAQAQRRGGRHDSGQHSAPGRRDAGERPWADQGAPGWADPGDPSEQDWRGAPAGPAADWGEAAAGGRQDDPGRRDAEGPGGTTSGEWQDPRGGPARPEPGGRDPSDGWPRQGQPGAAPSGSSDSGRVIADRAQRNSGRITGRLTRRTDRGSLFRGRRGAAGADAPTPPPEAREAGPTAASPPAWATEQPSGEQPWSPEARGAAPDPGSGTAWSGEQPWSPAAPGAAPDSDPGSRTAWTSGQPSGEQPWSHEIRRVEPPPPTPPRAWARGGETAPPRFAEPARFVEPAPAPPPHPGYADGQELGEAPEYGAATAGTGEFGLDGFGYGEGRRLAPPQEQEAWDEEPAEAGEDGAAQQGGPAGRWMGARAPAARGRQGRGAHGHSRTRTLPRLPKVGQARIPQASLALAGIAIVVAGGLVGLMNLVPKASPPAPADAGAPYSARWVCPLLPNSVGTVTANNVGQTAASIEAGSAGQQAGGAQPQQLAARATHDFHAHGGVAGGFVQVEAFGAPVAATSAGQPPCVAGPGTRWWLPGLTSSGDSKVTLVIANPETVDATVNITPHLTEGSLHPESLQNVFVRAGTTVSKDINVPEVQTLDYTAEVVASQGRVVVGARLDTKIGNNQEHLIVPAQPALRSSWAFSGGLRGESRQVELLVTNPNPDPLSLVVEGVNDQGPFKVAGFDLPIGDGAINEALVPVNVGKSAVFGLRVRSQDGSKFVAALRYGAGGGPINTSHLDLGGSGLDARWMAPVVPESRRLVLANMAQQPVTATVSALGGASAAAATTEAGKGGSVTVEPGEVRFTDVPKGVRSLLLVADAPGLVAAPVGPGQLVPGSEVGGVPLEGAVTTGPAAAP